MPCQRIVVIGEEKSGKTCLVDTMLGYDILPREIKTTRPIELKLVHVPENTSPTVEIEEGPEGEPKKYSDFKKAKKWIGDLLMRASDTDCGNRINISINTNSSADMIVCDCISPDPNKPDTMDVVRRNITNTSNIIILCMNPIHLKEENAQIKDKWFGLIREVDPGLSRTILVFTNVDTLPSNFNYNPLKQYLKEKSDVLPLELGAVCVKANTSYSSMNPALNHYERDYFNSHKVFQFMPNEYFTCDALAEKINKYITETYDFKKVIIEMNQKLKERISKNEKELQKFGSEYIDLSSQSKDLYMQSLINLFCKTVDKAFSGKAEIEADNLVNNDLKKIYVEFLDNFCKNQPSKNCKQSEIITIIQRSEGALVSGFPTGEVIYNLLDEEVESLRQEIKAYLDNVYLVVNNLIKDLS